MYVLDRYNKKGLFIVTDNCRIHHSHFVVDAINKRDHKDLFVILFTFSELYRGTLVEYKKATFEEIHSIRKTNLHSVSLKHGLS